MSRREKTEFILEQVQLCIERGDFTQATILSRKISTKFFDSEEGKKDHEIMHMKIKYYTQQIILAKQEDKYLDACKHYRASYDTVVALDEKDKKNVRSLIVVLKQQLI